MGNDGGMMGTWRLASHAGRMMKSAWRASQPCMMAGWAAAA